MQPRSVRPIPAADLHAIFERRPTVCIPTPANENAKDRATGGRLGLVIMFTVAVWLGFALALGAL